MGIEVDFRQVLVTMHELVQVERCAFSTHVPGSPVPLAGSQLLRLPQGVNLQPRLTKRKAPSLHRVCQTTSKAFCVLSGRCPRPAHARRADLVSSCRTTGPQPVRWTRCVPSTRCPLQAQGLCALLGELGTPIAAACVVRCGRRACSVEGRVSTSGACPQLIAVGSGPGCPVPGTCRARGGRPPAAQGRAPQTWTHRDRSADGGLRRASVPGPPRPLPTAASAQLLLRALGSSGVWSATWSPGIGDTQGTPARQGSPGLAPPKPGRGWPPQGASPPRRGLPALSNTYVLPSTRSLAGPRAPNICSLLFPGDPAAPPAPSTQISPVGRETLK